MIGKTSVQAISWGSRTQWATSRPAMSNPSRAAQRSRSNGPYASVSRAVAVGAGEWSSVSSFAPSFAVGAASPWAHSFAVGPPGFAVGRPVGGFGRDLRAVPGQPEEHVVEGGLAQGDVRDGHLVLLQVAQHSAIAATRSSTGAETRRCSRSTWGGPEL